MTAIFLTRVFIEWVRTRWGVNALLPSSSKSISRPFLRRTLESQYSDVFSCSEAAGPCSIPPRQRPAANATDRSKSSDHAHMHSFSCGCCCCCPELVFSSFLSATKKKICYWTIRAVVLWIVFVMSANTHLKKFLSPQFEAPAPLNDQSLAATCWSHSAAPAAPTNGWGGAGQCQVVAAAGSTLPGTAGRRPQSSAAPLPGFDRDGQRVFSERF